MSRKKEAISLLYIAQVVTPVFFSSGVHTALLCVFSATMANPISVAIHRTLLDESFSM